MAKPIPMTQITFSQRELLMPSRRSHRPVTDDMRQMLDDIGRVEPLPPLVLDSMLKSFARQLAEGLDRSFLLAIRGWR